MASSAGTGVRAPESYGREMRLSFEEVAKKLSLWHSATFRPILTHDDLELILVAAGFVPLPATREKALPVAWKEYAFLGGNAAAQRWLFPQPRLPYPRIDGLHLKTYEAFLGALEACIGAQRVGDLFHIRLMHVTDNPDRVFDRLFRPMRNCIPPEDGVIVYREGTLDERTIQACSRHTAVGDHVVPGISCRDLGYLRKVEGNCHDEGCCAAAENPAGYNLSPVVLLKNIRPDLAGGSD